MEQIAQPIRETSEIIELVEWLARFGKGEDHGVTRLLYTNEWVNAQHALQEKMDKQGFDTYFDAVGNLFGRIEGVNKEHVILTGSHIDTVINGGKFDGAYGVLASFLAVKRLIEKYGKPKKTIEVVSLCEEEGSRFPLTFWGSKNITGEYSLEDVKEIADYNQMPFYTAMEKAGFPLHKYKQQKRTDIKQFIEVHIEQGTILENYGAQIGIVSHIVGQRRFTVKLKGRSNHAGTTPMDSRQDALLTAAICIEKLTQLACQMDSNLRCTIGHLEPMPNVPNVIAGMVEFSLDIRHHSEEVLDLFCAKMQEEIKKISTQQAVKASINQWAQSDPVRLDDSLHLYMEKQCDLYGFTSFPMISGAGHDSQVFASHYPTTLFFIPSVNGISHSPFELTREEDLINGVTLLMDLIYKVAYEEEIV